MLRHGVIRYGVVTLYACCGFLPKYVHTRSFVCLVLVDQPFHTVIPFCCHIVFFLFSPFSLIFGVGWWRDIVVSGVRRMSDVNAHRARLVLGWVGIPSRYVTSQLVQLSLASLQGCLIEYQLRLG